MMLTMTDVLEGALRPYLAAPDRWMAVAETVVRLRQAGMLDGDPTSGGRIGLAPAGSVDSVRPVAG